MFLKLLSILFLLKESYAFLPSNNRFIGRNQIISASHFSTIYTELKEKDILVKSLKDMNLNVFEESQVIVGDNEEEVKPDIIVKQNNGEKIGFTFNGENYEFIADLQYWDQKVPVEVFLERLNQRYSVNSVLETASQSGFCTDYLKVDSLTGTVEIELSRYDY
tara:strand:+ start:469 stop:957 length:489 start_codon:yes stop_codon:yes gene_type:complete